MSVGTFSVAAMAVPPPLNFGLAAGRQLVASGACERRAAEIHATAHKERGEHFQRVNNTHTHHPKPSIPLCECVNWYSH
jgi:hypothetical protein